MQCLLCYEFLSGLEYLLLRMFLETMSKHKLGKQKGVAVFIGFVVAIGTSLKNKVENIVFRSETNLKVSFLVVI